jgi:Flp pilus assembly pilin Flp
LAWWPHQHACGEHGGKLGRLRGPGTIEYGVTVVVVALALTVTIFLFGNQVGSMFSQSGSSIK